MARSRAKSDIIFAWKNIWKTALETNIFTHDQAIIRAHTLQSGHATERGSELALHGFIHCIHNPTPILERVTRSDRSSLRYCGRHVYGRVKRKTWRRAQIEHGQLRCPTTRTSTDVRRYDGSSFVRDPIRVRHTATRWVSAM